MAMEAPSYVISASSHSAALFRQAAQTMLAAPGIVGLTDLAVAQQTVANMSVQVAAGMVWCPGTLGATAGMPTNWNAQTTYGLPSGLTAQGCYATYNDGTVNLTISAANPSNPRIDLICASIQDAAYSGATNTPVLQVITGTAAASPSPPTAPASTVVLAQVLVGTGVTSIVTANITDERPVALPNALPLLTQAIDYLTFVPSSGTNTPGSGTATWVNMGNVVIPTWCTQAMISLTINGAAANNAAALAGVTPQLAGSFGATTQRLTGPATAVRLGWAGNYLITGLSGTNGVQALRVVATFSSGTFTADTGTTFGAIVSYLP